MAPAPRRVHRAAIARDCPPGHGQWSASVARRRTGIRLADRGVLTAREQLADLRDRPPSGTARGAGGDVEVLPYAELGEDAPILRHEADTGAGDPVGRPAGHVLPAPNHPARARRRQPHDRAHGGRFADPVAAEKADALRLFDLQRNAEQDLAQAVGSADVLDRQQGHQACSPR